MRQNRIPIHPGEMRLDEFLKPAKISQRKFAPHIGVTTVALSESIRQARNHGDYRTTVFAAEVTAVIVGGPIPRTGQDVY